MKSFMAVILIIALGGICGCETLRNAFCNPTAEAVMAAGEKLSQAEGTLAFLLELAPVPEVAVAIAALQIAIPILRKIKNGICVSPEEEANAAAVAKTSLTQAGALGYRGVK